MTVNYIENDFCKLWLEDDVLFCRFQPYLDIDISVIKKCVTDRINLSAGLPRVMLADVKYLKFFNSDAREFLASTEGSKDLLAIAFLVNTQIEKFIIKLFIEVNSPSIPCAIFTDKAEALKWLSFYQIKKNSR